MRAATLQSREGLFREGTAFVRWRDAGLRVLNGSAGASRFLSLAIALAFAAGSLVAAEPPATAEATRLLAMALVGEGRHESAAIEFRRMALFAGRPEDAAGCYWAAAYEYHRAGDAKMTAHMLDLAEEASSADSGRVVLLRGDNAIAGGRNEEAVYFMEGLLAGDGLPDQKAYASVRLARALVSQKQTDKALAVIGGAGRAMSEESAAISAYARGRDKKPWVGGLLGLVPGLGHAYSGEYANGLRALLLNAIFIYGMVDTADAEAWGGFAVISFFELTWYSGSIYGGVDAAHRFNRNRMDACLDALDHGATLRPDLGAVPAITVKYEF